MTTQEIAAKTLDFDEDGFLANPDDWTPEIAVYLAGQIGITPLTDRHWTVIDFCRNDFQAKGESPTLRRITKAAGIPTKELYKLFPKGPAKKVAYVAGLKKPTGCI